MWSRKFTDVSTDSAVTTATVWSLDRQSIFFREEYLSLTSFRRAMLVTVGRGQLLMVSLLF